MAPRSFAGAVVLLAGTQPVRAQPPAPTLHLEAENAALGGPKIRDALSPTWETLRKTYGDRKMLALTEFGKVPDAEKMRRFDVKWSYFMSWTGDNGPRGVDATELKRFYTAPAVFNSDDVARAIPTSALQLISPPPAPAQAPLAPVAANYRALREQTEANLRDHVLDQWFPRAVSQEFGGGFDQNFSENWTNLSKGERSVVYQSRLTWLASQAALRYPAEGAKWKAIADHGAQFLRSRLWDAPNGGFFWALEAGIPARGGEKHAYGNAFAIYALAAHYHATGDKASLQLAQNAFNWLDKNARDAKNRGYFEALTREGRPIMAATAPGANTDFIGTRYGYKSMNTHIHLLEAFAALYEVAPEKKLRSRLNGVFVLARDTITVSPPGAMHLYFRPDWTPVPDHDSFGHDIETAFLLVEAARALGMPDDAKTWAVARNLVDHTLDFALDTQNGGFYDAGGTFGGVTVSDKIWWVQAEALNALLLMHQKYGAQTPRYWNAFQAQWHWIQTHQVDAVNGGWLAKVAQNGAPMPGAVKSDGWTEGYHQGRALLGASMTLEELLKPATTRP